MNIILMKSKKDVFVATSSTHAEINAVSYSRVFLLWALESMTEWGFPDAGPITVYEDNISTIIATHDGRRPYSKLSHLNVRYFALKEDIDDNRIKMVHCPTEDQLADDLTKPKGKKSLIRFFKTMNYKDEDVIKSEILDTTLYVDATCKLLEDQLIY